jgi:hypothetical protein
LRVMKLTAELYLMLRYRNPHKVEDILLQKQWVFGAHLRDEDCNTQTVTQNSIC